MLFVQRFRNYIEQHELMLPSDKILVGVSGGIDSIVLCELMAMTGVNFGIAHFNFMLRGEEADMDEKFVIDLAKKYNVPFFSKHYNAQNYASEQKVSVQMAARELRYDWFEELRQTHAYNYVAVASHQGDEIETVLLNLIKGTGLAGLHGIYPKRGAIIRPLLFANREEIREFAADHVIMFREDSSNASMKYVRNKIRHRVIPVLNEINPSLTETFSHTIAHIREAESFIKYQIHSLQLIENDVDGMRINVSKLTGNPFAEFVLFEILKDYGFSRDNTNDMLAPHATVSGQRYEAPFYEANLSRGQLFIRQKMALQVAQPIQIEEATKVAEGYSFEVKNYSDFTLIRDNTIAILDWDKLNFPLTLRSWQQGDKFIPLGMVGYKKISDLLTDLKLNTFQKQNIKVIEDATQNIVWVVGVRIDDRYKIGENTKSVYLVQPQTNQ